MTHISPEQAKGGRKNEIDFSSLVFDRREDGFGQADLIKCYEGIESIITSGKDIEVIREDLRKYITEQTYEGKKDILLEITAGVAKHIEERLLDDPESTIDKERYSDIFEMIDSWKNILSS